MMRPSVVIVLVYKTNFSETSKTISAKFVEKVAIRHTSSPFTGILKILNFRIFLEIFFCFVTFLNTRPYGVKTSKCYSSNGYEGFQPNFV